VIGNHVSILDGITIAIVRDVTTVMPKAWVNNWMVREFFDVMHPVYINRRHVGNTDEIIKKADDLSERPVMIFPEEATTNGEILLQFHTGAFITPYRVQPMLIRYWMLFVPKKWNTVASVGQSPMSYLWQLISMPLFVIEVECLHSISMEIEGKAEIQRFTRNAQIVIANHLKVKAVSMSSEDVARVLKARRV
jgi:1-acyl-sn-glycerol-3-phosphate acyltransferase